MPGCCVKKLIDCPKDGIDSGVDYLFDFKAKTNGRGFSDYLRPGESITTYTTGSDAGITIDSDSAVDANTAVVVFVSGGTAATPPADIQTYEVWVIVDINSTPVRQIKKAIIIKVV